MHYAAEIITHAATFVAAMYQMAALCFSQVSDTEERAYDTR
ncbi:MAG: hypothetical protein OJF49_000417 [Ktedonobacterales bacterium]|nr:MAG: hypothetical protein OJF49_000417 [Ktedonobacterales bacterium]